MSSLSNVIVSILSSIIITSSTIDIVNINDLKQEKKQLQEKLDFFEKILPCDTLSAFENGHYQGLKDCIKIIDTVKVSVEVFRNLHYQDSTLSLYTNQGILYYKIIGKNHRGKGSIYTHSIKHKK